MEPRRVFRFGVACARGRSRHDWWEKARKAEQLGYATFLVPDHLQDQLAPVPALLAAADATTTLRIGSHVFANDFRHPVMLAREAATLDLLSDGRFELGLGAGWGINLAVVEYVIRRRISTRRAGKTTRVAVAA